MVASGVEDVSIHLEAHQNKGHQLGHQRLTHNHHPFGNVWGHAASACDAASVSRVQSQEYVKPDDHTVSACVSNDLPGAMLPVGLKYGFFQQRIPEPQVGRISGA
jgi:hypothetical protein